MLFHFVEGNEKTDRVMPGGTGKAEKQRDIHMEIAVMVLLIS